MFLKKRTSTQRDKNTYQACFRKKNYVSTHCYCTASKDFDCVDKLIITMIQLSSLSLSLIIKLSGKSVEIKFLWQGPIYCACTQKTWTRIYVRTRRMTLASLRLVAINMSRTGSLSAASSMYRPLTWSINAPSSTAFLGIGALRSKQQHPSQGIDRSMTRRYTDGSGERRRRRRTKGVDISIELSTPDSSPMSRITLVLAGPAYKLFSTL